MSMIVERAILPFGEARTQPDQPLMRHPPEIIIGGLLVFAAFSIGLVIAPPIFRGDVEIGSVKLSDWLLVIFNFLLAVFTGLLWWSTKELWRVTREIGERQALDT